MEQIVSKRQVEIMPSLLEAEDEIVLNGLPYSIINIRQAYNSTFKTAEYWVVTVKDKNLTYTVVFRSSEKAILLLETKKGK